MVPSSYKPELKTACAKERSWGEQGSCRGAQRAGLLGPSGAPVCWVNVVRTGLAETCRLKRGQKSGAGHFRASRCLASMELGSEPQERVQVLRDEGWGCQASGRVGGWTGEEAAPSAGLADQGRLLTHQRDPHAQRRPVDAEVLQHVVTHEAQHRQARPGAGVGELPENPQRVRGRGGGPSRAPPWAAPSPAARPWATLSAPKSQFPHLKNGALLMAPLRGSCGRGLGNLRRDLCVPSRFTGSCTPLPTSDMRPAPVWGVPVCSSGACRAFPSQRTPRGAGLPHSGSSQNSVGM